MLQERYSDLQAMYVYTSLELRRWFRIGELMWCVLEPPIDGVEVTITVWPGLVDDCSVKSETAPRPKSPSIHSADGDFEIEDGIMRSIKPGRKVGCLVNELLRALSH
jgi:hypothetical protein